MVIEKNYKTRELCTMKVGGVCDIYAEINDVTQLGHVAKIAEGREVVAIGCGSNVVFGDRFSGVVIRLLGEFNSVEVCGSELICGGGAKISTAFRCAMQHSLSGLEELCHIPASVGGGVATSCGAFGRDIGEIVKWVEIFDDGEVFRVHGSKLQFGYRKNSLKKGAIITKVCFELEKKNAIEIANRSAECLKSRRDTQPLSKPSAGSVFLRSEGVIPAKLIEEAGLKGYIVGGLQVSKKHAGFVVNIGGGTPADFKKITADIKNIVYEKIGKTLKKEIKMIGKVDF